MNVHLQHAGLRTNKYKKNKNIEKIVMKIVVLRYFHHTPQVSCCIHFSLLLLIGFLNVHAEGDYAL